MLTEEETQLAELDTRERYARETLRMLDYPKGLFENFWWVTMLAMNMRRYHRMDAHKELRDIATERSNL